MESITELKNKVQSGKRQKDFLLATGYTWHRNISIYITRFLLIVFPRIKPNQVSLFMILLSIVGALMLTSPVLSTQLWGIALVYLGFLLDKVDGEIARYKNIISLKGAYLDELYHILIPNVLLFGWLYFATYQHYVTSIILMGIILLNLVNRFNRKLYLMIATKFKQAINEGKVREYSGNKLIKVFFNNPIFKIFSIIERFDVVILSIFVLILLRIFYDLDWRSQYLYVYFVFSAMYFIRWTFLNYFGNLDKKVRNIIHKNY